MLRAMDTSRRLVPLGYAVAVLLGVLVAYFGGRLTGAVDVVVELGQDARKPETAEQVRAFALLEVGRVLGVLTRVVFWGCLVPAALVAVVWEWLRLRRAR